MTTVSVHGQSVFTSKKYTVPSGWKWRTAHAVTKCLLSRQKSTLSILNNPGESEGLLTQSQSVCCQDRSQHSVYWTIRVKVKDYSRWHKVGVVRTEVNTQDPGAMTWQCSSQVGMLSEKKNFLWTSGDRVVKWRCLCWTQGQNRFKPYFGSRSVGASN